MAGFSGSTFGAVKGFVDEKIGHGPQSLGYVRAGGTMPTTRKDGTALQEGDYCLPHPSSSFPLVVGGVTFANKKSVATYISGGGWSVSTDSLQFTNETPVKDKANESLSGTSDYQSDINKEIKLKFADKEDTSNKFSSFDDLPEGDLTKYPNGHAVRELNKKNIPATRKVANISLENDITIQQIVDAFKELTRTYKNVTIDCDDNTLKNILVSCFKAGEVFSSMPVDMSIEQYKLLTAKGIYDFVISRVQGAIRIKGSKDTLAEITGLTDMEDGDEWYCVETGHFYLYTTESDWVDVGGGTDVSAFITKADIVNNLTTNDSQKPLSAAMGKKLKEEVDDKQDKIDITQKGGELATLNPTMNFVNRKLNFFLGMTLMNIEASPNSPVVNWGSERKNILKLATPPQDYSYPSQTRVQISRPSGYWTCEENRHEFYDVDGDHYVNPTIGVDRSFNCISVDEIAIAGHPIYDVNGNVIHLAKWESNTQGQLIVEKNGTPFVTKSTVEVFQNPPLGAENPKVYVLEYGPNDGYHYVDKYYTNPDGTGEVTGHFWNLIEVPITFDTEYMYKCFLMNYQKRIVGQNFVVDSQGRLCEYKIVESEVSKMVEAKPANTVFSDFQGFDGTITITPINHSASLDETTATIEAHTAPDPEDPEQTIIDYYNMFIHGANAYTNIVMQKAY